MNTTDGASAETGGQRLAKNGAGLGRWLFVTALVGITLLGAAARWHYLDYPVRYDEAWNYINYSCRGLTHIATHYVPNNHVLHTLLVRLTMLALGDSPPALRTPAFLAGVLMLPVAGWLAWVMFRRRVVVLLTMLACAGASALIEYSANSRGYGLQTVFVLLAAIVTLQLLDRPTRYRLWLAWAVLGALGAYTIPTMVYPMFGFTVVLALRVVLIPKRTPEWRRALGGFLLGTALCGLLTALLYLPVLVVQGWDETTSAVQRYSVGVYDEYLQAHGNMFIATWEHWTRHTYAAWHVLLVVGAAGYLLSLCRRAAWRNLRPLVALVTVLGLPGLAWVQGVPMTPPGWLFALPIFLACAAYGVCHWPALLPGPRSRAAGVAVIAGLTAVGATAVLDKTARQPYMSTWDHELVDVEPILDECEQFGYSRCALVIRYTPATQYYLWQRDRGGPLPLRSEQAEVVFIAVGTLRTLDELWNADVPGYEHYGPPRVWRKLSRSTLYIADRRSDDPVAPPATETD